MRQTFHFLLMKFCFEQLKTQLPLRSGFFFSSKHLKMPKWDDLTELFSGFCSKPIFGNFIFTEKIGHPNYWSRQRSKVLLVFFPADRLHFNTWRGVSFNQQSRNDSELVNHPKSVRFRRGRILMSSRSNRAHKHQNPRAHRWINYKLLSKS